MDMSALELYHIWDREYYGDEDALRFWGRLNYHSASETEQAMERELATFAELLSTARQEPQAREKIPMYEQCERLFTLHERLLDFTLIADAIEDLVLRACFYSYLKPIHFEFRQHRGKINLFYSYADKLAGLVYDSLIHFNEDIVPVNMADITLCNYENNINFLLGEDMKEIMAPLYERPYDYNRFSSIQRQDRRFRQIFPFVHLYTASPQNAAMIRLR
jgi:hypothetical protein